MASAIGVLFFLFIMGISLVQRFLAPGGVNHGDPTNCQSLPTNQQLSAEVAANLVQYVINLVLVSCLSFPCCS